MNKCTRSSLEHSLEELVQQQLGNGRLCEAELAIQLNLSMRSLQRRLAQEGSSYSEIVLRVKNRLACEWLRNTNEPIGAIAKALGFTDSSNFSRAFRRWAGCSPRHYRRSKV
jgi:AraC-like DNA-binding protein